MQLGPRYFSKKKKLLKLNKDHNLQFIIYICDDDYY